jgi:hypothetical protein
VIRPAPVSGNETAAKKEIEAATMMVNGILERAQQVAVNEQMLKRQRGKNDPLWSGELDADLSLALCNAYNLAFFDATLKGASTAAMEAIAKTQRVVRFGVLASVSIAERSATGRMGGR